jgi:hypothetical protein
MIPSSACQPWRTDQTGPCRRSCWPRQLHHLQGHDPNRSCVHLARPSGAAGRADMSQTAVSTHEHRAPPLAAAPIPERHHRHRGKLRPRSPRPRLRPRHPRRRPVARLKSADADTPAEPKLGIVATLSREISRWRAAARSLMPSSARQTRLPMQLNDRSMPQLSVAGSGRSLRHRQNELRHMAASRGARFPTWPDLSPRLE